MVLLAAEHWLVGSDKNHLQHSQMNIVACLCQYGEKGCKVVSLRQCEQALRLCFQVSGYSDLFLNQTCGVPMGLQVENRHS